MKYCHNQCQYRHILGYHRDPYICCLTCPVRADCIVNVGSDPCVEARQSKYKHCDKAIPEDIYILDKILE